MAHRISKNRKYVGKNDMFIRSIAGIYRDLEHAIANAGRLKVFRLRNTSARLYDPEMTEREIGTDVDGLYAVGFIEAV
jgi:hypothetical protein